MKLVLRRVKEMNESEYKAAYSLNLRTEGYMRERLVALRHGPVDSWAVMLFEDDILQSWSLVFEYDEGHGAYFYTRRISRGKGYGTQVATFVENNFTDITVWPSDTPGLKLFNKYDFNQDFKYWVE